MDFSLTILGSNSAVPASGRHPTAQILRYHNSSFLIDCGEGTQFQLNKFKIKRGHLDYIFISHLHGDHYFGLIGLITTFHLYRRRKPLTIFCPAGLKEIIEIQLRFGNTVLTYDLIFEIIDPDKSTLILDHEYFQVKTVILSHRIPCTGFVFREKPRLRKMKGEKIRELNIPYADIPDIRRGQDWISSSSGRIANELLTEDPAPSRSFAYISDTVYLPDIINEIHGIDLLYHEATFDENLSDKALLTSHSTAAQAAKIARAANVKKLIIGHFSSRYKDLSVLLSEAQSVFKNTELAIEGTTFMIGQ